jgi:hypothetical protein
MHVLMIALSEVHTHGGPQGAVGGEISVGVVSERSHAGLGQPVSRMIPEG